MSKLTGPQIIWKIEEEEKRKKNLTTKLYG